MAKAKDPPKERISATGLRWIKRKSGHTPYWVAGLSGYRPATVNLSKYKDNPAALESHCAKLEGDKAAWLNEVGRDTEAFDGTIGGLIDKYRRDEDSPYHKLRPGSKHPYDYYLDKLSESLGDRRIDKVTGVDMKRWHRDWSDDGRLLAASKMTRSVLFSAVRYGIMCRLRGCSELRETLSAATRSIPNPKRRDSVITAEQVVALRAAAHADGRPSCALAYALVFETTLRLWDVIGQWWPMDAEGMSDVSHVARKQSLKWFGLRWSDVGSDLVLQYTPSKTSEKTGLAVTFPLARAPMVMEELAHWPEEKRVGPVIVSETTGLPYKSVPFTTRYSMHREAAGLPKSAWARDLRASGITEARAGGVALDDAGKVAGHAGTKTTAAVYDRAVLEAAERFADARVQKRNRGK